MTNSHIKLSDWIFADTPAPTGIVIPDYVVSYWKLDEVSGDAVDALGNYTLSEAAGGAVSSGENGLFNRCRTGFSGSNYFTDGAETSNPVWRVDGAGRYVFETFFRLNEEDVAATLAGSPWHRSHGSIKSFLTISKPDTDGTKVGTGDRNYLISSDQGIIEPGTTWHHAMAVKLAGDAGAEYGLLLYLDGELVANGGSDSYVDDTPDSAPEFHLGKGTTYVDGENVSLCDTAFWDISSAGLSKAYFDDMAVQRWNDGTGMQYTIS